MEKKDPLTNSSPSITDDATEETFTSSVLASTVGVFDSLKILHSQLLDLKECVKLQKGFSRNSRDGSDRGEGREQTTEENIVEVEGTTDGTEVDIDRSVPLTPEPNYLTWPQWRKLRLSEYEWEKLLDFQKREKMRRQKSPPQKFVIDLVVDMGDVAHTEKSVVTKRSKVPCRIRINSQHILDALNEITNIILPQNCQMLHPFKIIVDHLDKIQAHAKTLKDNLSKAKNIFVSKIEDDETSERTNGVLPATASGDTLTPSKHDMPIGEKVQGPKTKEEDDLEAAQEKVTHFQCFMQLIENNLAPEIEIAKAIKAGTAEKIMFQHLWHLFPPGETIYYQNANRDEPSQASQVLKVSGGRARLPNASTRIFYYTDDKWKFPHKVSPFTIDAFHLDFDGRKFRLVQDQYEIPRYTGESPIAALPVFPLRFLPKATRGAMKELLLERGRNFQSLATVDAAHREYRGMTLDSEPEEIDGRVIVDFKQAPVFRSLYLKVPAAKGKEENFKDRIFGLRPLSQTKEYEVEETIGDKEESDLTLYNDHTYDSEKTDKLFSTNRVLLAQSQEMTSEDLTKNELRLLPGTVYAYILRSRRYCKCDINFIKEIQLNTEAFDDLVLPPNHRTLIKSLVERHSLGSRPVVQTSAKFRENDPTVEWSDSRSNSSGHGQQDTLSIVKGKGRGLIILLHGVPGVGKTSTAETIAEATGRPLLPVTCGDIGENATEVEKNLEQIFTNSHKWGCVLLLDEAEVFLTKRNIQDLSRNAMVSVFLRALEFYSGILFLTTNRVGTIDEAFKSRIHISLYYPPLDWITSKLIWEVNLKRSQSKVEAKQDEIIKFAKKHFKARNRTRWNGRQIYNAVKTAIALAEFEQQADDGNSGAKPKLTANHLEQVAHVAKKFDDYLHATQGESIARINKEAHIRADKFGRKPSKIAQGVQRRSTGSRRIDLDDLPGTDEEISDSESDNSSSDEEELGSESEPESQSQSESEEEAKKPRKKKYETSSKRNESKKKKSHKSRRS